MKKSLLYIILSNIFYMVIVAGNNFLLPKYTSVDTYATIKEYMLYTTTYTNFLTLGYVQGVYIKYGGKKVENIVSKNIGKSLFSYVVFLLPISFCVFIIGVLIENFIIAIFGIGIFCTNLQRFYEHFYQATGEFKAYGEALNISKILIFLFNLFLLFVVKTDFKFLYIIAIPIMDLITAIYLTLKLSKKTPLFKNVIFDFKEIIKNIKCGFVIMLGDFVAKFFSSVGRWFVKILMSTFSFALYSFAVSMEQMVNTFMSPITVSMYNYFCKKPSNSDVKKIKDVTLIYSFVIIAGAFPAKWILENFITKYIASADVIFLLFAAQGVSAIIRGVYVNKYKAEGEQKKYLHQMICMLLLAVILSTIAYVAFKNIVAIAATTLIINILWLIWCEIKNSEIRYGFKATLAGIIMLFCYIFCGYKFGSICGCVIYCVVGLIVGFVLMKDNFVYLFKLLLQKTKSNSRV